VSLQSGAFENAADEAGVKTADELVEVFVAEITVISRSATA